MVLETPKCEICSDKPAKLVLVRRLNEDLYRTFVCLECAQERTRLYVRDGLDLDQVVLGLDKITPNASYICKLCGTTLADLVVGGKPGCSLCYTKFAGEIEKSIETTQGRTYHVGKNPEQ